MKDGNVHTCAFLFVIEAISPMGKEEVLEAKMAVEGAAESKDYTIQDRFVSKMIKGETIPKTW